MKTYRDIVSFALLGVAILVLVSGMSLLFKSSDDFGGAGFAGRAATVGWVFEHPILVVSLVVAVLLAVGFDGPSRYAVVIVYAGLAVGAISFAFGLLAWISGFSASDSEAFFLGGVYHAGKIVGIFLGIAELGFLGLALFVLLMCARALPRRQPRSYPGWGVQAGPGEGWPAGGYQQQTPPPGWGGPAQPPPQQWAQRPPGPGWQPPPWGPQQPPQQPPRYQQPQPSWDREAPAAPVTPDDRPARPIDDASDPGSEPE